VSIRRRPVRLRNRPVIEETLAEAEAAGTTNGALPWRWRIQPLARLRAGRVSACGCWRAGATCWSGSTGGSRRRLPPHDGPAGVRSRRRPHIDIGHGPRRAVPKRQAMDRRCSGRSNSGRLRERGLRRAVAGPDVLVEAEQVGRVVGVLQRDQSGDFSSPYASRTRSDSGVKFRYRPGRALGWQSLERGPDTEPSDARLHLGP